MDNIYKQLLNTARRRPTEQNRNLAEETESDRGRVIYSKAFRRLQQKTQVFPLQGNSAVRTRLTHSLEVSHVGRLIAEKILFALGDRKNGLGINALEQIAFTNVVETACLLHDIGNPPFGHFGEKAVQNWFRQHGVNTFEKCKKRQWRQQHKKEEYLNNEAELDYFKAKLIPDFTEFDGNPQGFRIATRLLWNIDEFGLNLTYAQLAAFLKYLRPACDNAEDDEGQEKPFSKKAGYFYSERDIVEEIRAALGVDGSRRHPLTYIMEAADDIAYCMSDIEDGLEKDLFKGDFLRSSVLKEWGAHSGDLEDKGYLSNILEATAPHDESTQDLEGFFPFKIEVTRRLIEYVVQQFVDNHERIIGGNYPQGLLASNSNEKAVLETFKGFARKHLYSAKEAENIELAGDRVITGLLERFEPLLICSRFDFEDILAERTKTRSGWHPDLQRRLFHMLPSKHVKVYRLAIERLPEQNARRDADEWFHRAHLVVDYISGMTDTYALEKFQMFSGIRVA
jgi:dGTPase